MVRGYNPTDSYVNNTLWYSTVDMVTVTVSIWSCLPGTSNSSATLTRSQTTNFLTIVVKSTVGSIYTNNYYNNLWHDWSAFSGSTIKTPAATMIGDQLHLIVIGGDGITWHGIQNQANPELCD